MTIPFKEIVDYSMIIDDMLWSYSRLSSFDDCKYGWFLKYIKHAPKGEPHFFSTYGSFCHDVLEKYLSGELTKDELVPYFLEHYDEKVEGRAPSKKVEENFFNSSLAYLEEIDFPFKDIEATEKKVRFEVGGHPFIGYIDVLAKENGGYHIVDHKSHGLRPRSGRKVQTEYDKELDQYLRQQYLYAIPIYDETGEYPQTISFNCYRHGRFITEQFDPERMEKVRKWAADKIEEIRSEKDWEANPEEFRCTFICDCADSCPYKAEYKRRWK